MRIRSRGHETVGEIVREQVGLYGTLTGSEPAIRAPGGAPAPRAPARQDGAQAAEPGQALPSNVLRPCAPGRERGRGRGARGESGRRAEGRSLARAPGLAAVGAQVQDALERLGHEVVHSLPAAIRGAPRPPPNQRSPVALRMRRGGRNRGPGAPRGDGHSLHRLRDLGLHAGSRQGRGQARHGRRRDPHARLLLLQRDRVQGAGGRRSASRDRGSSSQSRDRR